MTMKKLSNEGNILWSRTPPSLTWTCCCASHRRCSTVRQPRRKWARINKVLTAYVAETGTGDEPRPPHAVLTADKTMLQNASGGTHRPNSSAQSFTYRTSAANKQKYKHNNVTKLVEHEPDVVSSVICRTGPPPLEAILVIFGRSFLIFFLLLFEGS